MQIRSNGIDSTITLLPGIELVTQTEGHILPTALCNEEQELKWNSLLHWQCSALCLGLARDGRRARVCSSALSVQAESERVSAFHEHWRSSFNVTYVH